MNVPNERTPLLLPQIGFKDNGPMQPVPAPHATVDAHRLMYIDLRFRKEYITLRAAETPMPNGGYNVITLTGGHQRYYRSLNHTNKHAPWFYRMANGTRDCFVVWGRSQGGKIFPTNRTARTSSGYGAIYTRWPIIDPNGALAGFGWETRVVRFQVLSKNPHKGDALCLELVHRVTGQTGFSMDPVPYGVDNFIRRLVTQAKDGFDRECNQGLDPKTDTWRTWFLHQQRKLNQVTGSPEADKYVWRGWLEELDKVTEAWQLAYVLRHYRHLFPEQPPRETEEELRRILSENPHAGLLAIPEYEGTDGSRESRLLQAYYALRPNRRELFDQWMTDYVSLVNKYRNYTGD